MANPVIENNFTYHAPTEDQIPKFDVIRCTAKSLAYVLDDNCPDSREKSLAMTKLEECVMWANASIARNQESNKPNHSVKPPAFDTVNEGYISKEE